MTFLNNILEITNQKELSIIFFSTNNCGVCKSLYPKIKDLADTYNSPIIKLDLEEVPIAKGHFMVFTVPTILMMRFGKEIFRTRGSNIREIEFKLIQFNDHIDK